MKPWLLAITTVTAAQQSDYFLGHPNRRYSQRASDHPYSSPAPVTGANRPRGGIRASNSVTAPDPRKSKLRGPAPPLFITVPTTPTGSRIGTTPVWWGHGTADNAIGFDKAEAGWAALTGVGAALTTVTREGMGHSIDAQVIGSASEWLAAVLADD